MITFRDRGARGHHRGALVESFHSFSFGDYIDPKHMGFRSLRVINEDFVAARTGFGTHPHRDMEIITYVLGGAVEHKDSMGTTAIIRPGEVQRMSAGTGVMHSEFNASKTEPVHLLQIWILPEAEGIRPGYEQKVFAPEEKTGKLKLVASPEAREGSLKIHQNVALYDAVLREGDAVEHRLAPGRHAWVQVVKGAVEVNGTRLAAGDGAAVSEETSLDFKADGDAEILLFDLA